ncbi:MAG: hypothetical protein IPJ06_04230 [Saprospiraceae bacterium]|nr:hypothetical protein [Saprospiraceae bacterium]
MKRGLIRHPPPTPTFDFPPRKSWTPGMDLSTDAKTLDLCKDTHRDESAPHKIPVIMLNTFGPDLVTGWAFGGERTGIMRHFWAHPLAMKGACRRS